MSVLVTGGTGFLGSSLSRRLLALGYDVTVLGRNALLGAALAKQGMEFIQADFKQEKAIRDACKHRKIVFHCGALSSPWGSRQAFYEANVLGTSYVADACLRYGVERLIHVSSPSIYFDMKDRLNLKENDPLPKKFVNHYAETKYLAEQKVDQIFSKGLPVVTIRPRAIFGPGDTTILPRLIRANRKFGLPLVNHGKAVVDITYIDNAVDALLCCMTASETTFGKKYNITNGTPVMLQAILKQLFDALGEPYRPLQIPYSVAMALAGTMEAASWFTHNEPVLTRYGVGVLAKSQTLDIEAARHELGYCPNVTVADGLKRFAQWWKEQPHG